MNTSGVAADRVDGATSPQPLSYEERGLSAQHGLGEIVGTGGQRAVASDARKGLGKTLLDLIIGHAHDGEAASA